MGRVVGFIVAVALLAPAASAQTPEPSPAPGQRGKLKLEPWVDPYGKVSLPDLPRYRDAIEVPGKAMDSVSLTARMAWFMGGKAWQPLRGAVPTGGSAPRLEDTYDFRPRPAPALDLQGVVKAVIDELRKKK